MYSDLYFLTFSSLNDHLYITYCSVYGEKEDVDKLYHYFNRTCIHYYREQNRKYKVNMNYKFHKIMKVRW